MNLDNTQTGAASYTTVTLAELTTYVSLSLLIWKMEMEIKFPPHGY